MATRSVIGTVIFILLIGVHLGSVSQIIDQLLDFYYFSWLYVLAQVLQMLTFILYVYLLMCPVTKQMHRLGVSLIITMI